MISYSTNQAFTAPQLEQLFLSVGWSSGKYPDKLVITMKNSHHVVSAWDGSRLVGLMNALSDGIMTAYFHYLLVDPLYQKQGVGKHLVEDMLDYYQDYARKVLIAYDKEVGFYQHCGFDYHEDKKAMFITYLET